MQSVSDLSLKVALVSWNIWMGKSKVHQSFPISTKVPLTTHVQMQIQIIFDEIYIIIFFSQYFIFEIILRCFTLHRLFHKNNFFSSGTSKIGNCGGIDNPTHYTRLKKLRSFILDYVDDKENLCFSDGPITNDKSKTEKVAKSRDEADHKKSKNVRRKIGRKYILKN